MNCTRVTSTITDEIGYCVTDGGLIDENANGPKEITSTVTVMLGLLYTIAPGTESVTNCSPDVLAACIS